MFQQTLLGLLVPVLYHTADELVAVLLELPLTVVERADLASLQPTRDAVEMEGVLKQKLSLVQCQRKP